MKRLVLSAVVLCISMQAFAAPRPDPAARANELLNRLYGENPAYRRDAAEQLLALPESALPTIHEFFENRLAYDRNIRLRLAKLVANLDHERWEVREATLHELSDRYGDIALPYLETVKDPSRPNQWKLIQRLIQSLQSTERNLYVEAQLDVIRFLSRLRTPEALPLLSAFLDYEHPSLLAATATALGELDIHEAVPELSKLLDPRFKPVVHFAAIHSLRKWMDPENIPAYLKLQVVYDSIDIDEYQKNMRALLSQLNMDDTADSVLDKMSNLDDVRLPKLIQGALTDTFAKFHGADRLAVVEGLKARDLASSRIQCLALLGEPGVEIEPNYLRAALTDSKPEVRMAAIRCVARVGGEANVSQLRSRILAVLNYGAQTEEACATLRAVGDLRDMSAVKVLERYKTNLDAAKFPVADAWAYVRFKLGMPVDLDQAAERLNAYEPSTQRLILDALAERSGIPGLRTVQAAWSATPGISERILLAMARRAGAADTLPLEDIAALDKPDSRSRIVHAIAESAMESKETLLVSLVSDAYPDVNADLLDHLRLRAPKALPAALTRALAGSNSLDRHNRLLPFFSEGLSDAEARVVAETLWDCVDTRALRAWTRALAPAHGDLLVTTWLIQYPQAHAMRRRSLYLATAALADARLADATRDALRRDTDPNTVAAGLLALRALKHPDTLELARRHLHAPSFELRMVAFSLLSQTDAAAGMTLLNQYLNFASMGRSAWTYARDWELQAGELLWDQPLHPREVMLRLLAESTQPEVRARLMETASAPEHFGDVGLEAALSPGLEEATRWIHARRGPRRAVLLQNMNRDKRGDLTALTAAMLFNRDGIYNLPAVRCAILSESLRASAAPAPDALIALASDPHFDMRAGFWHAAARAPRLRWMKEAGNALKDAARPVRACAQLNMFAALNPEWNR